MKRRNFAATATAVAMAAMMMAGCGGTSTGSTNSTEAATTEAAASESVEAEVEDAGAAAPGEAAGFTEYPIFEDVQLADLINLSAVYFQAVPMAPDQESIDDFDIHLEADISALENELGYGTGDWIPYLTVDYKVTVSGSDEVAAEGTFMPMSASDGPHYGANIALPDLGTYDVTFTIHSPAENGYLIHSDSETGPGKILDDYFADGNLEYTFEGWEYTGL